MDRIRLWAGAQKDLMQFAPDNPITVCVLAGGLGTRLRCLTETIPKPMLPVGDKPFLQVLLERLAARGFRRFVLAVSYRWEVIRDFFGDGTDLGWQIDYSVEPQPLGTGGAVLWAKPFWGQRAFVLNGDTYLAGDWPSMVETHVRSGLPATMALVRQDRPDRYGRVVVRAGTVVRFREKAAGGGTGSGPDGSYLSDSPGWVNGGAYVLEASALAGYRRGEAFSLEREVFPSLVGRIRAFPCEHRQFTDIGTFESLEAFRKSLSAGLAEEAKA